MPGSMERLSRTLAVYKGQFCHSFAIFGRTDLSHMCSFVLVETRSLVGLSQGWKMYLQRCRQARYMNLMMVVALCKW